MNPVEAFAAARRDRMKEADGEFAPLVVSALSAWSDGTSWYQELVEAASVLWLETFERTTKDIAPDQYLAQFQEDLGKALSATSEPSNPPDPGQVHRVTYWLSTYVVNNATYHANRANGAPGMRWATMRDGSVRDTHRAANGQIADRDGTFDIGGFDLHYPGEPVGPPEIWINCRCILVPGQVEGALDVSTPIVAGGFVVQVSTEQGDLSYGPFDTRENAQDWMESNGSPFDGEFEIVEMLDPDETETPVEEKPPAADPPPAFAAITDEVVVSEDAVEDEMPMDEPEDDEELITEIPVHGVATIEGKRTGDGREFALGSARFGNLPQPLGFEFESSHGGDNSRVAMIGRIDEFWKVDNGEYTEVRYRGVIHPAKPYATQAIEGIVDGSYGGVSIIADDMVVDVGKSEENFEAAADGTVPVTVISDLQIRRFDMVPTPAYQEAYIALGAEFPDEIEPEEGEEQPEELVASGFDDFWIHDLSILDDEALAIYNSFLDENKQRAWLEENYPDAVVAAAVSKPGTKDGPGWITHPIPTARIRRYWVRGPGAAKIRWGVPGDFNRCRKQLVKYIANPEWLAGACANMHKEALGIWPGQESGKRAHSTEGVAMSLTAAGVQAKPHDAFSIPEADGPTPLTIEGDRIFGHLATWGVCHIGIQDVCTVAPHSSTNYGFFHTGTVVTDEGRVPVGQITMGTGHAGLKASRQAAVSHYDNTGTAVADVRATDGVHGIWVSGLVRPSATEEQLTVLQASALSGDWRWTANGLELVAALAVNVPGFPIPRTSLSASVEHGQESLVAAGIVTRDSALTAGLVPSAEEIAGIVRTAIEEYRFQEDRAVRVANLADFGAKARESVVTKINDYFKED